MLKVNFYDLNTVDDKELEFAVMVTRLKEQWLFVRHKERTTWEIPGGHREINESIDEAAKRELKEETGALEFKIEPVCIYSVEEKTKNFGQLYYVEIMTLSNQLESEIAEVAFFDHIPENLTYPLIMPALFEKILTWQGHKTREEIRGCS